MDRSYKFTVRGQLPPKKGSDQSLFAKPLEAERALALRKAALHAMGGAAPLAADITLGLVVHVGERNDRQIGDLDNFVSGVCDALMAATPGAGLAACFELPQNQEVAPHRAIGLVDDVEVLEILARKVVGDAREPWYEVTLSGR